MNAIAELPLPGSHSGIIDLGGIRIDLEARTLHRQGEIMSVGSRAFDILVVLAKAEGRLVTKDELMSAVWPRTVVEENNIQVHLSSLRKNLGSDRDIIVTVPGRGYRLTRRTVRPSCPHAEARFARPELIGREDALARISTMLAATQVLTLVGAGGIGKSALALEAARQWTAARAEPIFFADLARLDHPRSVQEAIARACGLPEHEPLDFSSLPERGLVFIDNAEHVIAHAAQIVDALAAANDGIRVLVTSREPLRIMSETLYRVDPLDVPRAGSTDAQALEHASVRLFLRRGRAVQRNLGDDSAQIGRIGTICRRLDGNPLAIELATARLAALGLEDIHRRLNDRMSMLAGGYRTALPRHQTLRANFDWSYGPLAAQEKTLLRRMAVFEDSFSFEALCAVAWDDGLALATVIDAASELAAKSLLIVEYDGPVVRYRLSESMRAYALERLAAEDDSTAIAGRLARYLEHCVDFSGADEANEPDTPRGLVVE
ncbi:winged helix-turn-helix domain-containing protein [Caballeronia sp. TF1N1]|uniref:winged helix-turn-helix domain-containing protein n=1 Tax=Caballeronia sp. TF1N1 TaxID=2878153 RepID=UPI001FD61C06|nr:winged helix-turn-helix domain-containing protein [Caballeronia sp. TF1N1]